MLLLRNKDFSTSKYKLLLDPMVNNLIMYIYKLNHVLTFFIQSNNNILYYKNFYLDILLNHQFIQIYN